MDRSENEAWRADLAANLTQYRKQSGLTQTELGEKLNYSDKSVSKWERGEGVPDISVLVRLSDMYSVSLDEMLGRTKKEEDTPKRRHPILHRAALLLTICALVMISALAVYMLLSLVAPSQENTWMSFVIALPVMFSAMGIAFLAWKEYPWAFGSFSVALWTGCVMFQLLFPIWNVTFIYATGGILQLAALVTCGFILLHKSR